MPNIITHKLFAEIVFEELDKFDIRSLIEQYPQIFYIGSNGPDFLFFYHAKPWEAYKNHTLNALGSRMHASHINDFYRSAFQSVMKQKKKEIKDQMMVYIFGHLCHWTLDKTTHPYVFYKTGTCKGKSAAFHHRFESMLDTKMLKKMKNIDIRDYPAYKICEYDEDILRAIARIYVPAARDVYGEDITVFALRESLNSWYDVQKMLYDPHQIKFPILQGIEKITHQNWVLSSHVIQRKDDATYDVLNEEKQIWKHPCDEHVISNASFMELFEQAVKEAHDIIIKAYGVMEYDASIQQVVDLLKDQAYDTGMDGEREVQFFDVIYKE